MATKTKAAPKGKATSKAKAAPKGKAAPAKAAPAPRKKADGPRKGRPAAMAGKQLTAIVETNTRKKGSHGHKSLGIIIANPGITYEDFIRKGGRSGDLNWDVEKGNVIAKG